MDLGLVGQCFIVLGGTRGAGYETVRILAQEGANVAVLRRDPQARRADFDKLEDELGVKILPLAADAGTASEVDQAIKEAIKHFDTVHGLAVTNHWMGQARGFEAVGDVEWEGYFQNSLMGTVRAVRALIPHLVERREGSIVLSSAYSAQAPKPSIAAYAAFKAALENLVRSLAQTYGSAGVRVNAVAPGTLRTARYDERLARLRANRADIVLSEAERMMLEDLGMRPALGRIGDPAEVAAFIVFLLSQRASYMTGQVSKIDGGALS